MSLGLDGVAILVLCSHPPDPPPPPPSAPSAQPPPPPPTAPRAFLNGIPEIQTLGYFPTPASGLPYLCPFLVWGVGSLGEIFAQDLSQGHPKNPASGFRPAAISLSQFSSPPVYFHMFFPPSILGYGRDSRGEDVKVGI